jgi:cystathionine gamma-synthase
VLAELPNNPGLASPQLAHLKKLAQAEGALLILDPSSSGLVNVDLMPYADVLVTSLTKYSGHRGDVMMGLIVVHPQGAHAAALRKVAFDWVGPVAPGDSVALAEQLPAMETIAALQNKNAQHLATFLAQHPAVARVLVADQGPTAAAYAQVARGPNRPGSLITFELKGDLAQFYNTVDLVKGPSFGLDFTLLAPFLWLSHFEWVTQEAGRARIRQAGLSPDLIRLSVGTEDPAWIQARLSAALRA